MPRWSILSSSWWLLRPSWPQGGLVGSRRSRLGGCGKPMGAGRVRCGWPAVPAEFLFNLVMLGFAWACIYRGWFKNQVFHVYLIAYGTFRFTHEFLRATPDLLGPVSGYQIAALMILTLGIVRYAQRVSESQRTTQSYSSAP